MDIEEIKRINRMTAELKKHGMAESTVDAYHQARASFEENQPQQAITIEQHPDSQLLEKKFQLLIELNNKKFQEAITILSNDITLLAQQLTGLKQEIQQNKQATTKIEQKQQEKQQPLPKQESHPRQGNYSPDDVSIEKMFYFGKK